MYMYIEGEAWQEPYMRTGLHDFKICKQYDYKAGFRMSIKWEETSWGSSLQGNVVTA